MPPKKKTKSKKSKTMRKRLSSAARRAKRRLRATARSARRNPRRTAGYVGLGLGGAAGVGLAGYETYLAKKRRDARKARKQITGFKGTEFDRYLGSNPYESPTLKFTKGLMNYDYRGKAKRGYREANYQTQGFMNRLMPRRADRLIRKRMEASPEHRQQSATYMQMLANEDARDKAARRRAKYDLEMKGYKGASTLPPYIQVSYGKRRRRKRKSRCGSFGKKVKKPSAATKRMCKKLKVRLTVKRGKKRVYKSEKVLKKQCKKAMKRKKKKSKK